MKKLSVVVTAIFSITLLLAATQAFGTKAMCDKEKANDPSVTCKTCHTGMPKAGDADKKLNDAGKKYQAEHKEAPAPKK